MKQDTPAPDLTANVERFTGFADVYDRHRPKPPPVLREVLPRLAGVERPRLVVDLGSGTGLSTLFWSGFADEIVGVDPNPEMRAQAEAARQVAGTETVRFVAGFSTETGLPDACADIVTCSQSLHWMDPEPTFAEIARILRTGGVFAAYDCDWPPTVTGKPKPPTSKRTDAPSRWNWSGSTFRISSTGPNPSTSAG